MRPQYRRQTEINRLRIQLEQTDFPKLKMMLIVGLTGGAGFLASFLMLLYGITSMAVRYPIAIAIAYLAFLFLLWLWLRTSAEDYVDVPDFSDIPSPFGDGPGVCSDLPTNMADGGSTVSEAIDAAAGADEFAVPLIALFVIGALLLSSVWVVYSAPTLFAELLVDGVLSASLYRKLRGLETQHWLTTAVSRTIWPFVITAVIVGLGGLALQYYFPTAHSLGEAMHSHQTSPAKKNDESAKI